METKQISCWCEDLTQEEDEDESLESSLIVGTIWGIGGTLELLQYFISKLFIESMYLQILQINDPVQIWWGIAINR